MTQEQVVGLVVAALERLGVIHMVAGSFASNLHGMPRMTQDADMVVDVDERAALRLVRELEADFYVSEDAAREAVKLRRIFNAIHFDTGFKVDLVVKKQRPFSEKELERRVNGDLAGRAVPFASPEDVILSKLEWARDGDSERQYDDAVGVLQVQAVALDDNYLDTWADDLGVRDLLDKARQGKAFRS